LFKLFTTWAWAAAHHAAAAIVFVFAALFY
jgi:hypothetical protein